MFHKLLGKLAYDRACVSVDARGACHLRFFMPYCLAPVDSGGLVNHLNQGADYARHITIWPHGSKILTQALYDSKLV